MSRVLVTGASGYLGSHLVAALLGEGRSVRAVVRSDTRATELRSALESVGLDVSGLEFATASLTADEGWTEAAAGCEEVHHVASPMTHATEDPDVVVIPARDGALRLLRAAREAGARRVVLTSSFAAVGYSPKPTAEYDESDWTDPDTPGLPAYPRSKAVAERAAWDFIAQEGGDLELVSVNPTFILGPPLTDQVGSSLQIAKAILDGHMTEVRRQRFGLVDVRDAADAHLRAMATPDAAGRRYLVLADGPTLSWLEIAEGLRDALGRSEPAFTEADGPEPPALVIHNGRAETELGWSPRPVTETVADTATALSERGLLADG